MEFLLDTHTHTLASGHAYSTILEMAKGAADQGLELVCITDHGPGMPYTTHKYYFNNLGVVDRSLYGVDVLIGVELNLMDFEGTVDLAPEILSKLDMAIASMHSQCMPKGSREEHTHALLAAMDNPWVDIIGHPDDGQYPLDYPAIVRASGEKNVLLEINNSSLTPGCYRVDAPAHCAELLKLCKQEGVPVVVGSDAHFASGVGAHNYAGALLDELAFPAELVLNADPARFRAYLAQKRALALATL